MLNTTLLAGGLCSGYFYGPGCLGVAEATMCQEHGWRRLSGTVIPGSIAQGLLTQPGVVFSWGVGFLSNRRRRGVPEDALR